MTIPKKSTLDKGGKETKGFKDMNGGTKPGTMKTEGEEFMLFCPTPTAFVPGLWMRARVASRAMLGRHGFTVCFCQTKDHG